jgi:hypothetical protein
MGAGCGTWHRATCVAGQKKHVRQEEEKHTVQHSQVAWLFDSSHAECMVAVNSRHAQCIVRCPRYVMLTAGVCCAVLCGAHFLRSLRALHAQRECCDDEITILRTRLTWPGGVSGPGTEGPGMDGVGIFGVGIFGWLGPIGSGMGTWGLGTCVWKEDAWRQQHRQQQGTVMSEYYVEEPAVFGTPGSMHVKFVVRHAHVGSSPCADEQQPCHLTYWKGPPNRKQSNSKEWVQMTLARCRKQQDMI